MGAVTLEIEQKVMEANRCGQIPDGAPLDRLFIPPDLLSQLIHWAHTSLISCHPGVSRTVLVIRQRFWWPMIKREVTEYMAACPDLSIALSVVHSVSPPPV